MKMITTFSKLRTYLPSPHVKRHYHEQVISPVVEPLPLPPSKKLNRIEVSLADRWVLLGMTGSGKTTFAKELLKRLRLNYPGVRSYILDTKGIGDFDDIAAHIVHSQQAPDPLRSSGAIQIWKPPLDDVMEYSTWFERILKHRKPAIVLIDELSSIGGNSGRTFPRGYQLLNKQGRGMDISLLSLSQEAAYIPRTTLGQTTHLIRFRLLNDFDKRTADKILGRPSKEWGDEPFHQYGFYYRRLDKPGQPIAYKNWQDFLNMN